MAGGIELSGPLSADDQEFIGEHLAEGRVFRKYGLGDKARDQFEAVLGRFPDNLEALQELVDLHREKGENEAAAQRLRVLAEVHRLKGEAAQAAARRRGGRRARAAAGGRPAAARPRRPRAPAAAGRPPPAAAPPAPAPPARARAAGLDRGHRRRDHRRGARPSPQEERCSPEFEDLEPATPSPSRARPST